MQILDIPKNTDKNDTKLADIIQKTISVLSNGGMVAYPTETCYGIGVDATNEDAVQKLLQFKGNRQGKAISIAVSDKAMAQEYVDINDTANNIYDNLLPGPITVISKSKNKVVHQLESQHNTLGIRIPDNAITRSIIKAFGRPITATSANASGYKQPYSLQDFQKYNPKKSIQLLDLFLDGGTLPKRLPSTVVDTTLNDINIVRQGSINLTNATTFTSGSEQQTIDIAKQIMLKHLHILKTTPIIIAMQGNLGAGKTHFVKGVAKSLNITDNIKSPTYNLINEYQIPNTNSTNHLYHIDTWRIEDGNELFETLNFNNFLKPGNMIAIEWLEKIKTQLDNLNAEYPILWVDIKTTSPTGREISYKLKTPLAPNNN